MTLKEAFVEEHEAFAAEEPPALFFDPHGHPLVRV
jgi:hypothetical protein